MMRSDATASPAWSAPSGGVPDAERLGSWHLLCPGLTALTNQTPADTIAKRRHPTAARLVEFVFVAVRDVVDTESTEITIDGDGRLRRSTVTGPAEHVDKFYVTLRVCTTSPHLRRRAGLWRVEWHAPGTLGTRPRLLFAGRIDRRHAAPCSSSALLKWNNAGQGPSTGWKGSRTLQACGRRMRRSIRPCR
jgi:hypothetical protein